MRLPCQAVGNRICGGGVVVTNYCVLRDEGRLDAYLVRHPELREAAEAYLASHCPPPPPDWCAMREAGTLEEYLTLYPNLREIAEAYLIANCPTACEMTEAQMEEWVDDHPDEADETLTFMEANCPSCEAINWLRGYIAARDPDPIPQPTGDT